MKFVESHSKGLLITAYQPGWLEVNHKRYTGCVLLSPQGLTEIADLTSLSQLRDHHLMAFAEQSLQVVIIGTGSKLIWPKAECFLPLSQNSIGYEVMDTSAACRTYNILISEGRTAGSLLMQMIK